MLRNFFSHFRFPLCNLPLFPSLPLSGEEQEQNFYFYTRKHKRNLDGMGFKNCERAQKPVSAQCCEHTHLLRVLFPPFFSSLNCCLPKKRCVARKSWTGEKVSFCSDWVGKLGFWLLDLSFSFLGGGKLSKLDFLASYVGERILNDFSQISWNFFHAKYDFFKIIIKILK